MNVLKKRILAVDVGGGTQDILVYDPAYPMENCYKMILPSQTVVLARKIRKLTNDNKPLFLNGDVMGGGPCVRALKNHLNKGLKVYATAQAAKTIKDDPKKVKDLGVEITYSAPAGVENLQMGDIDLDSLRKIFNNFEIEMPEVFAVAVQDHGESLDMSNRLFRFKHWKRFIKEGGEIKNLAYYSVPSYLTRMQSVQRLLPGALMMDTCSAAVWGALEDKEISGHRENGLTLINMGNQHTFAVLLRGSAIHGLFEHHTGILNPSQIDYYVKKLQDFSLTHDEVFDSGGHGCYISEEIQGDFSFTAVTGPQRNLAVELGYYPAAPYGDMMLTGPFGLVSAALSVQP
ncbi:DUF1786 domain-containing protein [Candidatus Contubernalis alkaliaceticus]|uniref:DUF1786 domain-containing protein n=1 Tax=Candidatus Contubernalis alkaliaceticus TaxID=338645 RepID=UPI001F4BEC7E|nr:DUF1786 domain-containing protein [Candidatus Contubernalis alkalaceticus]UNC92377.1 DUF1786 domain-containing protein [Candidatus Contubernalis alkalaceticus]